MRRSASCDSIADAFAICISDSTPSCMRAPPDAEMRIERILSLERALAEARDLLADDRAHRAAHEREVHDAEVDRAAGERAR